MCKYVCISYQSCCCDSCMVNWVFLWKEDPKKVGPSSVTDLFNVQEKMCAHVEKVGEKKAARKNHNSSRSFSRIFSSGCCCCLVVLLKGFSALHALRKYEGNNRVKNVHVIPILSSLSFFPPFSWTGWFLIVFPLLHTTQRKPHVLFTGISWTKCQAHPVQAEKKYFL